MPFQASLINKRVKHVEIIEVCNGEAGVSLLLHGVGFQLEDGYFAVCNGLDENMLMTEKPKSQNYNYTII